jgi:hypothetical protein
VKFIKRVVNVVLLVTFLIYARSLKAASGSNLYNPFNTSYPEKISLILPDGSDIAPFILLISRVCRGRNVPKAVNELFKSVKNDNKMVNIEVLLKVLDECKDLLKDRNGLVASDAILRNIYGDLSKCVRALLDKKWNFQSVGPLLISTMADNAGISIRPHGFGKLRLGSLDSALVKVNALDIKLVSANATTLTDGTASFVIRGNGATRLSGATTVDLDSTSTMSLNSSGGAINIGNDADAQVINIGTGAASRAITVGNVTGVTRIVLKSGSGGVIITGALTPALSDGSSLGSTSLEWSDLFLADGGVVYFGNLQDTKIIHDITTNGLNFKCVSTGDDNPMIITLQTGEIDISRNDVIGTIDFQAPDEGTGADAILICAGIEAVSEGDFSATNNATKLSFKTAASETATEKMALSSVGTLTLSGSKGYVRTKAGSRNTPAYSFAKKTNAGTWYDYANAELNISNISGGVKLTKKALGWAATSDKRLSRDILPSDLGLDFINDLNSVSYYLVADSRKHYGLIGQELNSAVIKHGNPDFAVNRPKDQSSYYSICYIEFIAPLVKSIQELSDICEAMQVRNKNIQMHYKDLQAQVDELRVELEKKNL